MSKIRVGMSGWTVATWRSKFYPKKLVQKKELEYASRQVNSIEINGTFYSLQRPATFQNWYNLPRRLDSGTQGFLIRGKPSRGSLKRREIFPISARFMASLVCQV